MTRESSGFTLIELMVVVAIISVLAAIALPNYQDYLTRSQLVEAMALVGDLKPRVKECYEFDLSFPADNEAAGLPPVNKLLGNYVTGIELHDGAFHVLLGNRIARPLRDKVLTIRPIVVNDSPTSPFSWICGNAEPPEGMQAVGENRTNVPATFLPYNCR
jgi:type IV pilus assembly protein PilA